MNYKFVLIDPESGKDVMAWVLPLPVVVGRNPNSEIVIDDPSISRRHCQFFNDIDGALAIRDLESMNGIYLDDERVKRAVLRPGMLIQVGSRSLQIEWTDEPITNVPVSIKSDLRATQKMNAVQRGPE